MNILIIQEAGKHPENFHFREALNLQRAFTRMGDPCVVFGEGYPDFTSEKFKEFSDACHVILLLENYATSWVPDLSKISKPKIFWSIDAHWNLEAHLRAVSSHKIDHVLSSTDSYCQAFIKPGIRNCTWFPNAYPMDLIKPLNTAKLSNVGFCGNVLNRGSWLELFKNTVGLQFDNMVLGDYMVQAINSYKIHWNRNAEADVNCRTFETLGCGTFLLTNKTDRLADLFTIGEHLVTYETPGECLEKINYYLINESERETIAKAGHKHASEFHTYDVRARQFKEIAESLL